MGTRNGLPSCSVHLEREKGDSRRAPKAMIEEMALYAAFPEETRRYIVRALDFGLPRGDPLKRWEPQPSLWMGNSLARLDRYKPIPELRRRIAADPGHVCFGSETQGLLFQITAFDLQFSELGTFTAYRFLYERLFGPGVRRWLVPAFSAAATSAALVPEWRRTLMSTLGMFDVDDEGDMTPATFFPDWDGD